MTSLNLPVLADSRRLRLFVFSGLYVAQGLPYGLLLIAIPTWLATQGYSTNKVGLYIAGISLPWALKFFAGPIIDKFSFPSMGKKRPWVLIAQSGILICSLILTIRADFYWILGVGFLVNFCVAWQDVTVDGMAIEILPEKERGRANSFMFGGQMIGISSASATGAWLLLNDGIKLAALVMSICMILILLVTIFFRERPGEKLLPWTKGEALPSSAVLHVSSWKDIFSDLSRALFLSKSILLVTVFFGDRITSGILQAVFPILTTQELGFSNAFYPEWKAMAAIISALLCVIVSPVIDRITPLRAIYGGLIFKSIAIGVTALLADFWAKPLIIIATIFSFEFTKLLLVIASSSLYMSICSPRVAASQFAIYMALSNLAISIGSSLTGPLHRLLEFDQIFTGISFFIFLMVCGLFFFNLNKQDIMLKIHM